MKPSIRPLFLAIMILVSVALVGCNLRRQATGSGSGSGSGSGGGTSSGPFTIGGTVVGLLGTGMVVEDNGADDLTITANGAFNFKTPVSGAFAVTVKTQPSSPVQNCTVTNATGTATNNISNVQVNCGSSGLTLSGSVSGLIGTGLVLQNNGVSNFPVSGFGNVNFTLSTSIVAGSTYAVTILTQPSNPAQVCTVLNGTGTVSGNVSNVQVICTQPGFTIGGSVVGLVTSPGGDTIELQDNAGDDLFVTGDTTFTFPTKVTNGGIYNVSMFLPPFPFPPSQPQTCNLFNYRGIASGNVANVIVDCQHNDWNWETWYLPNNNTENNYGAVTSPLIPNNSAQAPLDTGTPGGRDFAASWTDAQGRRWLFGGFGYPFPTPTFKQPAGLLNDLWVFEGGGWVPANLNLYPTLDLAGDLAVIVTPLEATNLSGIYGNLHASSGGAPGSRWGTSTWTDASGNLWMFGGQGYPAATLPPGQNTTLLNDVWEWTPGAPSSSDRNAGNFPGSWIWQGGSNAGNQTGNYGIKGNPSALNIPGGRWAAATFTDTASNTVWLFGGQGYDSAGNVGILGDLWKYDIASGLWTWVSGSKLASPNCVYGIKGSPAGMNAPGGRQAAVLWVDASHNVWLFGGFGFDSAGTGTPAGAILNDLWEFTGGQWTWVSGNNLANQTGVYGTQTTAAAANFPGSRWGAVAWTDVSSNLWFFGGWGYGSVITDPTGFLDDIWEYQHSTGQWIWWKGTSNVNQNGSYLTNGIPFVNNVTGGRRGAAIWQPDIHDPDYVWIFGGQGYDSTQGAPPGYLNDIWTYLPFP